MSQKGVLGGMGGGGGWGGDLVGHGNIENPSAIPHSPGAPVLSFLGEEKPRRSIGDRKVGRWWSGHMGKTLILTLVSENKVPGKVTGLGSGEWEWRSLGDCWKQDS